MTYHDETPGDDTHRLTDALALPRTNASNAIEAFIRLAGGAINWIWVVLMLVIVANVTMRYALSTNFVWIEELQWHMYAVGFMIGIGYAITHDAHVRVDVVAQTLRQRTRAAIELAGIVLLMMPLFILIIVYAIPFVQHSWARNEISSAPGGLTNRWAIKSVLIIAFAYMLLAAFARLLRITALLFGIPKPVSGSPSTTGSPHA